jgi:hypothetical protein
MPDYNKLMQHGMAAQQQMGNLGQQQLDFARQQYQDMLPRMTGIADAQIGAMSYQMDQGKAMGDMFRQTYMPMLAEQANSARNFNTDAHREGLAQQAAADVARASANTNAASARSMASMGVNPNSGRFAGMQRGNDIALAAQRANAMTGTRRQAEAEGQRRLGMAITGGQALAGMSGNALASGLSAGNSAGAMYIAPGNNYMNAMQSGIGTIGAGIGYGQRGLGGAMSGMQDGLNNTVSPLGGAASGAMMGSAFGPWGALAGGALGYLAAR